MGDDLSEVNAVGTDLALSVGDLSEVNDMGTDLALIVGDLMKYVNAVDGDTSALIDH